MPWVCWGGGIDAHKALADDTRFVIQVSQETQDGVKAEMTDMLKALQTILNKTIEGDGKTIQEAVKPFTATGTQGHPEIVTFLSKYPDKFAAWRQMGRNGMHASFSRIETLAATQLSIRRLCSKKRRPLLVIATAVMRPLPSRKVKTLLCPFNLKY